MICKLCGLNNAAIEYFNLDNTLVLCHHCAEKAMENVHKARYGKYIRWNNAIQVESKYKKKSIPAKLKVQVHEKSKYRCVSCGSYKNLTCDHIKPEILGGKTELENLQTMCKSCNSSKGVKHE